ncbi:hypothetical protein ACVIGB_000334 [Bradyrhizobium sp. USDA 4341]
MNPPFSTSTSRARNAESGKAAAFLGCVLIGFALATCIYVGAVLLTVPKNNIPSTFKWLLLECTTAPRIIVDSGSNAHHGIDADQLAKAFNLTAINVADNAGYSLVDRTRRILEFAGPGDIVIMPIEWQGYFDPDGDSSYARLSLELITEYFWTQTRAERVRRVLTTPFPIVARAVWRNIKKLRHPSPGISAPEALHSFSLRLEEALLYSGGTGGWAQGSSSGINEKALEAGCFRSTIGRREGGAARRVEAAFDNLRAAKEKGIRVIITWPTVVGADCYLERSRVSKAAGQVRALASAAGVEVVGEPDDFWMPMKLVDNSFYHVIKEGRSIVTLRLIERLREAGLAPEPGGHPRGLIDLMSEEIYRLELQRAEAMDPTVDVLNLGTFASAGSGTTKIDFTAGWWAEEPGGRWARNNEAALRLRPTGMPKVLRLRLISAFEPRDIAVVVNDIPAGRISIDMSRRDYDVEIPEAVANAPVLLIRLKGEQRPLMRPRDFGGSDDHRVLTFLLEGAALVGQESLVSD